MWPVRDEMAASERFLSRPNRIFAAIWDVISALKQFFHITIKTAF